MKPDSPIYTADEFGRESRYLETLVWESLVIQAGTSVLFCGYGPDGTQVQRAIDAGAKVTVIEHRDKVIGQFAHLDSRLMRGSTSVIPAKENAFDLAVSFHYLHEVDPFFHAQILSELARVARRIAIVEPAPPTDPLGKRIALLYSQAKRELGQFEYYQPIEYWKKLLQAVKADVSQQVFAFAKVPPREYVFDTVELLLHTIEVEEAPKPFIDELRNIAMRSDAQLLPPPRFVLMGAALGELIEPNYSEREAPPPPPSKPPIAAAPAAAAIAAERTVTAEAGYEFPPVEPPAAAPAAAAAPPAQAAPAPAPQAPAPQAPAPQPAPAPHPQPAKPPEQAAGPPPGFIPGLPFGAPAPPERQRTVGPPEPPAQPQTSGTPFGAPFAMPAGPDQFGAPPQGIPPSTSWEWEPPEGEGGEDETPFSPGT